MQLWSQHLHNDVFNLLPLPVKTRSIDQTRLSSTRRFPCQPSPLSGDIVSAVEDGRRQRRRVSLTGRRWDRLRELTTDGRGVISNTIGDDELLVLELKLDTLHRSGTLNFMALYGTIEIYGIYVITYAILWFVFIRTLLRYVLVIAISNPSVCRL